jgi:hypothetical protein
MDEHRDAINRLETQLKRIADQLEKLNDNISKVTGVNEGIDPEYDRHYVRVRREE